MIARSRNAYCDWGGGADGASKTFCVGLHFIFARFVKSAEIVACLSACYKIEKLLCVPPEIVKTYEKVIKMQLELVI